MPVSFLSDRELESLRRFPADIPPQDVGKYFSLGPSDLALAQQLRGDQNRLGFTLQLCALRYLGFFPDDVALSSPAYIVAHLASQLGADAAALQHYGGRERTSRDHRRLSQTHLGFRKADSNDLESLTAWLAERALEHEKPALLFRLACGRLHRDKIVRPGITRLEKIVATARAEAQVETFKRLEPLLTEERRRFLDQLLVPDVVTSRTPLIWLRQTATSTSAPAILAAIEKLDFIRSQGVEAWDLTAINPNRLKFLAQLGRKSTSQMLQRAPDERRYPILVAFLQQTLVDLTDEIIELYDRRLAKAYADARQEIEDFRASVSRARNEKVLLLREIAQLIVDEAITDEALRRAIYSRQPRERLEAVIEECNQIVRPRSDPYYDFLAKRYSYFRQFAPAFVEALAFQSNQDDDPLIEAVEFLKALNRQGRRNVPDDAPMDFVPRPMGPVRHRSGWPDRAALLGTVSALGTAQRTQIRQHMA